MIESAEWFSFQTGLSSLYVVNKLSIRFTSANALCDCFFSLLVHRHHEPECLQLFQEEFVCALQFLVSSPVFRAMKNPIRKRTMNLQPIPSRADKFFTIL
ncbi:MAG: hypothetical protein MZV64_57130 [Ignavibacteriales bacterium]|nr:hypothetical protein [Ignavibacteriales bacterium]